MTAVLLVFQYGQPRIFFSMARDGLLPQWAAKLNPKTRIPATTTLITGVAVALAALIGDAAETYDLTNIGTLFAFALVCTGVLVLRIIEPERPRPFKVPAGVAGRAAGRGGLHVHHGRAARTGVGAVRDLARGGTRAVLRVRVLAFEAALVITRIGLDYADWIIRRLRRLHGFVCRSVACSP